MSKFSLSSLFSSFGKQKDQSEDPEAVSRRKAIVYMMATRNFTANVKLELFKDRPLIITETKYELSGKEKKEEVHSVFFFKDGRLVKTFSYLKEPAIISQNFDDSLEFGDCVSIEYHANGHLILLDNATAEGSYNTDRFTFGDHQLPEVRTNVTKGWDDETTRFEYFEDAAGIKQINNPDSWEIVTVKTEGNFFIVRNKWTENGRLLNDKEERYDSGGRLIREIWHENGQPDRYIDYVYDAQGNEVSRRDKDRRGLSETTTTYKYDERGNWLQKKETRPNGLINVIERTIHY